MRTKEHPSVAIGSFLGKKGYALADETGHPFDGPVLAPALGILSNEVASHHYVHFLWWTFEKEVPRRIMLGVLRFRDEEHATLDVYGRSHIESMMLLAHEIEVNFHLKVNGTLKLDGTVFES